MPSKEIVQEILKKIQRRADYEFFFENLKSADWITPLQELGYFKEPDKAIVAGGSVRYPIWPPAKYLVKVAPLDPDKVMDVILGVTDTSNPRVQEEFVDAALAMPGSKALRLKNRLLHWLRNPEATLLLLHKRGTQYANHIKKAGYDAESLEIIDALLAIDIEKSKLGKTEFEHKKAVSIARNDWEYEECIKAVVPEFTGKTKRLLVDLLIQKLQDTLEIEERDSDKSFCDYSHIWRGTIEGSHKSYGDAVKDVLINWIRDLSEELLAESPLELDELVGQLRSKEFPIFSRIALHLARVSKNYKVTEHLLLDQALFDNSDTWHEYAYLLQDGFQFLSQAGSRSLIGMIRTATSYVNDDRSGSDVDEDANDRERFAYLFLIAPHLSGNDRDYFETLHKRYGDLENPTGIPDHGWWQGPTSPKSFEELKTMPIGELASFLNEWRPEQKWFSPSMEGLGRELDKLVNERYIEFSTNLGLFRACHRTYVRAIIQGLSAALGNAQTYDWDSVIDYLLWASQQPDSPRLSNESHKPKEEDDQDPTWGWARQAACRLLEKGFHSKMLPIPFSLRDKVWLVIEAGLSDPDPTPERDEKYTSDGNYYQRAINTVRGEALDSALHYGLWVRDGFGLSDGSLPEDKCPELFRAIDEHLNWKNDPSKSIRAMFGRWIPWLRNLNKEWFASRINVLLPTQDEAQDRWSAAWYAFILFDQPYIDIFPEVTEHYLLAVERLKLDGTDEVKRIEERLIDHVLALYLWQQVKIDSELIRKLYNKISVRTKGHIIGWIGRAVSTKDLERSLINRGIEFWNHRLAECKKEKDLQNRVELSKFGSWMESRNLSEEWLLDQAITVLNECHQITPDFTVMDRLVELAEHHPNKVAEAFRLIVEHRVSDYGFFGWTEKAELLLPILLNSPAREKTINIIHKLGAYGLNEFRKFLPREQ